MTRTFITLAAFFGATGVALGAFGAHGLAGFFAANPEAEGTFQTAVQYHQIHALALIGAAWAADRCAGRWSRLAGWLLTAGVVLFSGSLYLLSLLDLRFMGAVAPLGGASLVAGWTCLGIAAWRAR